MAYENMEKEEITARNMGQDMGYLLSLTPSLVQSSESGTGIGYTNFRIRGVRSQQDQYHGGWHSAE